MSELIVVRGPGKGASVALSPERSVTIGSGLDAAIRVGGADVAQEHVVVKALKGGGFGCKALAGRVQINGRAVEAARLSDGDVLSVGDCEIRYAERTADAGPQELAGFTLLGVLGKGGMGVVWRAEQKSLGREVALKVLSEELTKDPVFVARFQAEARSAARLHHPNVVQVFDVDHVGGTWFYSMELMHGGSLETRIKREGKLPVDDAVRAVRDAAKGLEFAEQMKLVHRDIKPDNLMVDRHGHVKLADLGIAQVDDDADGKLRGTPHFMSPEQVQRKPLDHRSDLYSLGCTFYRLMTGRSPFSGESVKDILRAQVSEAHAPANKVEPAVPQEVSAIVDRLLQKDPAARYQTATELAADLEQVLAPPAKKGLLIGIAAAAVVVAGVALALALRDPPQGDPREVIKVVTDPNAQRALAEASQKEAEIARLSVKAKQLSGLALAEALEKVAADHPKTRAAEEALEESKRVRVEVADAAARAAARNLALDGERDALRKAVAGALAHDDVPAALAAVAGPTQDPSLAEAQEIATERETLRKSIVAAAATLLAARRASIESAEAAQDLVALDTALAALDGLVRGEAAWPETCIQDRAAVVGWLDERKVARTNLARSLGARAEDQALAAFRQALFAKDGLLDAIDRWEFLEAAKRLAALANVAQGTAVGANLGKLATSLAWAEHYCIIVGAAVTSPSPVFTPALDGAPPATVLAFTRDAGRVSLTVRADPNPRTPLVVVEGDRLAAEALEWLPELQPEQAPQRAAAIAWVALAAQLRGARSYLASLDPADDQSGAGEAAFVPHKALAWASATLQKLGTEELAPLATELAAANLCARALFAFATQRHATAIARLERLFERYPQSLVVRAQR
ncbi:MAG: protein kinase [Planctomycetes bacterium]|nr:protein kinase [Planctomycetota bacterium]